VSDYPAARLCDMASDWLAARYPGALIVRELSIGSWGKALIDIAAITDEPGEIVGVEIKGDGDSTTRVPLQAAVYSKAATRMFILASPNLAGRCKKAAPDAWGHLQVEGETISFHGDRYGLEPRKLCEAPAQMLQCLWKPELLDIARFNQIVWGRRMAAHQMAEHLAEHIPLATIRREVCAALRRRNWGVVNAGRGPDRPTCYRWAATREEAA
jgi:hypothetical protein